jgi:hypothetical protein
MAIWRYQNEKELAAIKALKDEADRSAAIIAATFVEDRLTKKLKANLEMTLRIRESRQLRLNCFALPARWAFSPPKSRWAS